MTETIFRKHLPDANVAILQPATRGKQQFSKKENKT